MKILKRIFSWALIAAVLSPNVLAKEPNNLAEQVADSALKQDAAAYYLINEDFSAPQPNSYSAIAPSGWDIVDLGGGLGSQNNKSFTVIDNNESLPVKMRRKFNAQQDKITWEFTVNPSVIIEETRFELRNDETVGISLAIQNGWMTMDTQQGKVALSALTMNTICGVKAEVDIAQNICTVWTDGKKRAENIAFLNPCRQLDNVYIETGNEAEGRMDIGTVRISRGFSVNERFLTSTRELPEDWTVVENGGNIAPEKRMGALYPDIYSLKITDNDFLKGSKIRRTFSYEGEELWLEYQFLIPEHLEEFNMTLGMGASDLITLGNKGERFGYTVLGESFQPIYNLQQNLWYHVMVKLTKEGARVYLNHKLLADHVPIPFFKVDNIRFETGKNTTGELWLDDIIIKSYMPLPEDYVPEPVVPEHGDYLVGMQSCNMWKEGSHYGWDWINPFEERHSYMGFYDEGSSEVKDWEIKWMLEHGIDYELFCWYRPPEGNDVPIKYPRNAYALHEGFFNAEYSNKTKFAIAWENGGVGVSGSKDFRENVVRFWLEQYFKDSRYLVVDNKPVVSIYNFQRLKDAFGDISAIRAEMDYLRQACINAGFSGCIILMSSSTKSAEEMQSMKDAGIDCIYNYSWGQTAGVVENQMTSLTQQRDLGVIDMMATMSMGRDDTPWERNAGSWASVEDFSRLLLWVKDEFISSLPADSLGHKFVMFGNWNEYGEGHFLSPCNLAGFGYLDEIRNVFSASSEEHSDARPSERQKERINHLYVQDRTLLKPAALRNSDGNGVPENVKLGYTFDSDSEGWTVAKQVEGFTVENGLMKGTSVGTDPGLYSPPDLNIKIGDVSHVRIRIRTNVTNPGVQLYYITDKDENWNQSKCVQTNFLQTEGEIYELILSMKGASAWNGTLKQVRLDPLKETGDFEIDSVEFLSQFKEGDLSLALDGEQQFFNYPLVLQNDVMMVPVTEVADVLEYDFESTLDRDGIELLRENNDYVILICGEKTGVINGKPFDLPEPAFMTDGIVYFPLRAVAETLGFKVKWDDDSNMANLISPDSTGNVILSSVAPDPSGSFNFNQNGNMQGWVPNGVVSNAKVKNGILSFQSVGTDPVFTQNCSLKAEDYPYLHIKIKNATDGGTFQLYFGTTDKPGISAEKMVSVNISANSEEFIEYTADMRTNSNWKGTVNQLRMDPTNRQGKVEIDYVILNNEESIAGLDAIAENLISNGTMDMHKFAYVPYQIKARFSAEQAYIGRYSLLAEKQSPQGAIRIDVPLKQGQAYHYQFWIYLPQSGSVTVGAVSENGEVRETTVKEVAEGNRWTKIEGSFIQEEETAKPQIYITADTEQFYLDGITLREVN